MHLQAGGRRVLISAPTTFHSVSNRPTPLVSVVSFGISTRIIHPNSWGSSPMRHMWCTRSTRHIYCSLSRGSSNVPRGMPPVTTTWNAPCGGGYVLQPCVGVGVVPLPPPPQPMGSSCLPFPVRRMYPGSVQGGMAYPSDSGSETLPWNFPFPSGRAWVPVQTIANTNVSVWRTIRRGPPLPWKAPGTPRSPLLHPLLASRNTLSVTFGRLLWSP